MKALILQTLLFTSIFLISCKKQSQNAPQVVQTTNQAESLHLKLDSIANAEILPGFAVSVFNSDSIYYQKGYGFANINHKSAYKTNNIQIIASVTKTLVGVALMKAVEDNLLDLDDDINSFLPYKIVNPNFPDERITLRMLASHTSSISGTKKSDKGYRFETPLLKADFPEAYHKLAEIYNKTETISMTDFLQRKLDAKGTWYDQEIFLNEKPGTVYEYSNIGIALIAEIIQIKSNQAFDDYVTQLILEPIQMSASHWDLAQVPQDKHVTYYNELKNKVPNYYIITYPDGGLYSSVADMTKYLQEMMRGYNGKSELLSQSSFKEMMKKQFQGDDLNDGVCWDLSFDGLIGHSGNDFGTATLMYFSPESGIGRILFTNISIETEAQEAAFYGIFNTLFEYDFQS